MLLLTCSLCGGLNYSMFRFFAFLLMEPEWLIYCTSLFALVRYLFAFGAALMDSSRFHESWERRSLIINGRSYFLITGGWLDSLWTNNGWSLGFRKGQYFFDFRMSVMSKKIGLNEVGFGYYF